MFTDEQKRALGKAASILDDTGIKYVLMTKDEGEDPKSYYMARTDCTNGDAVYFVKFLLNIFYETAFDILQKNGIKVKTRKSTWTKKITREVIDQMIKHKESMKLNEYGTSE